MFINGRKIEGVIFDIDDTLVDSFPVCCSAFNRRIKEYNLEPVSHEFLMNSMKRGENLLEILRKVFSPDGSFSLTSLFFADRSLLPLYSKK